MANNLYNEELKNKYLLTFDNEQTQDTLRYLFYKIYSTEKTLGKDLCDFNVEEIGKAIQATDPMNISAAKTKGRVISSYITWCMDNGYSKHGGIHPMKGIEASWYDKLAFNKKLYITDDDIKDLINNDLVNPQDWATILLAFQGVLGHDLSEMLNLTKHDINFETGELHLRDDKHGERTITLSEDNRNYVLRILNSAISEPEYRQKNGSPESRVPIVPLVQNDYVIRPTARRTLSADRADKHVIYRRLTVISDLFDLPYLTAKNIEKSGMIKMARDLFERDGELGTEQYREIAERFGMRKIKMGNYETYNLAGLREFINAKNLMELYGVDIEVVKH